MEKCIVPYTIVYNGVEIHTSLLLTFINKRLIVSTVMVLLVLCSTVDELVFETKLTESIDHVTTQITILYNLRNELLALITATKYLLQQRELDTAATSTLNDLLDTCTVYSSTEQAKRRVVIHQHQLQQYIDDIVQQLKRLPHDSIHLSNSLPQYISDQSACNKQLLLDELNQYIADTNNSDNVQTIKLFDNTTSSIWFANKPLPRSDVSLNLSKYLGSNEKSIIKIRLSGSSTTQPASATATNHIDPQTKQAMMTYYQKQKKINDELQNQNDNTNSVAFNPNALKNAIHGFSNISYTM